MRRALIALIQAQNTESAEVLLRDSAALAERAAILYNAADNHRMSGKARTHARALRALSQEEQHVPG